MGINGVSMGGQWGGSVGWGGINGAAVGWGDIDGASVGFGDIMGPQWGLNASLRGNKVPVVVMGRLCPNGGGGTVGWGITAHSPIAP